jgi:hypothetical protein
MFQSNLHKLLSFGAVSCYTTWSTSFWLQFSFVCRWENTGRLMDGFTVGRRWLQARSIVRRFEIVRFLGFNSWREIPWYYSHTYFSFLINNFVQFLYSLIFSWLITSKHFSISLFITLFTYFPTIHKHFIYFVFIVWTL